MRTVEWKKRNGTMECHCLYTKEEAERLGIKYLANWRDGMIGDWVLTDDNMVVEVLRLHYDKSNRKTIGTATMTINTRSKKSSLDTETKENRFSLNGKKHTNPIHMSANLQTFCNLIVLGTEPEEAYIRAFYSNNTGKTAINQYVKAKTRQLMSTTIVKQEIQKGLGDKLSDLGMGVEWLLNKYKRLIEHGENESAQVTALNKIASFHGLDGSKPIAPVLPPIPQSTLDKLAGMTPVNGVVVEEEEPLLYHNGTIDEAVEELTEESEKDNETLHTHVGGNSRGAFNPDDYRSTGSQS